MTGTNDENVIQTEERMRAGAWYRATPQAEAVGMLAPPKGSPDRVRF